MRNLSIALALAINAFGERGADAALVVAMFILSRFSPPPGTSNTPTVFSACCRMKTFPVPNHRACPKLPVDLRKAFQHRPKGWIFAADWYAVREPGVVYEERHSSPCVARVCSKPLSERFPDGCYSACWRGTINVEKSDLSARNRGTLPMMRSCQDLFPEHPVTITLARHSRAARSISW